jgi:phosphopantetheinyl transferase
MPLSYQLPISPTATVAVWHLTETSEELAAGLHRPELYAAKVAGLKPESRRLREILAARRLLQAVAGEEWAVAYDADGRPYDADGRAALSISHTEGHVAVLVDRACGRVGIDIERVGRRVARVAARFLMPSELALLQAAEAAFPQLSDMDSVPLHLAWSAKETAYKVLGTSYYDLQHKVTLTALDPTAQTLELRAEGVAQPLRIAYRATEDYVLTFYGG